MGGNGLMRSPSLGKDNWPVEVTLIPLWERQLIMPVNLLKCSLDPYNSTSGVWTEIIRDVGNRQVQRCSLQGHVCI